MPFPDLFRDDVFHVETPRLWLRWPRAADARALQQIASIASVAEMTATWPHPLPETEAEWRILRAREANADGEGLILAVTRKKAPDQLIGTIGVGGLSSASGPAVAVSTRGALAEDSLGLGYMLDPAWHNHGFATEAVIGLTSAVFCAARLGAIRASSRTINPASRRVLEKAGFSRLGSSMLNAPARGGPVPVDDFELTRAAWLRARLLARTVPRLRDAA